MMIFVSSPYAAVLSSIKDEAEALSTITSLALDGCRAVVDMGYIPLSPVLAFEGVYDERTQRDCAIGASLEMLKKCDAIYIVRSPYNEYSQGMILEKELATRLNMLIYEGVRNGNTRL